MQMIARLGKEINHPDSIYYWAWRNNIPVFCPALTGMHLKGGGGGGAGLGCVGVLGVAGDSISALHSQPFAERSPQGVPGHSPGSCVLLGGRGQPSSKANALASLGCRALLTAGFGTGGPFPLLTPAPPCGMRPPLRVQMGPWETCSSFTLTRTQDSF